jgi:outer membrane protein assembly factor BamB
VRLLSAAALLLALVALVAADWPTYLNNPTRSAAGVEPSLSNGNAGQLINRWSFQTGATIAASATVIGNTVYVGSWDGNEYAIDTGNGAKRWQTFLGTTVDSNCTPPNLGVTSAAAVSNGVLYVGGGDSNWYALDANTGSVLWSVPTGDNSPSGGHYNWSSPLLFNGFAYIGISSNCDNPLVPGQLLQVNLSTHAIVNTFTFVPSGHVGGGVWTSPAIDPATNTVYVTTGTINNSSDTLTEAIVALDGSTLALKDSWQLPASDRVNDSDWGTSPVLISDRNGRQLVAATNKNGFVYAWLRSNLAAGPVWRSQIAVGGNCPQCGTGTASSMAFAAGVLYAAGGQTSIRGVNYPGGVRAIDPATGGFFWEHGAPGIVVPALAYNAGLIIDGAGPVLEVLNADNGSPLYTYRTGGTLYGAPSVGAGEIFAGSVDGNLYAFGLPSGSGFGNGNPPAAAATSGGTQYVVWKGTDAGLWEAVWNGSSWGGPFGRGMGPLGSPPTIAVVPSSGEVDVFWEGTDRNLWQAIGNGAAWSGPFNRGMGPLGSPPTATAWGGEVDVYWKGTDAALWEGWVSGSSWRGPQRLGMGPLGSGPGVAAHSSGEQDVFWAGADSALWEGYWSGSRWVGPQRVEVGPIASRPSVDVRANNSEDVFWETAQASLARATWNGSAWSPMLTIGLGPLGSPPGATAWGTEVDVFWQGSERSLWEAFLTNTQPWSGPLRIGMGPLG